MRGTILTCIKELVQTRFGKDAWEAVCKEAKMSPARPVMPFGEVPDTDIFGVIGGITRVLNITQFQALDAFADYWCNVYAPRLYKNMFQARKNMRDFLEHINEMHERVTTQMGASPPMFDLEWQDPQTLHMHYITKRSLIDLAVCMTKGMGKYYNEKIDVSRVGDDTVRVVFPPGH